MKKDNPEAGESRLSKIKTCVAMVTLPNGGDPEVRLRVLNRRDRLLGDVAMLETSAALADVEGNPCYAEELNYLETLVELLQLELQVLAKTIASNQARQALEACRADQDPDPETESPE